MEQENLLEQQVENMKTQPAIPAKFIDKETGELRADALIKSYLSLEQKLSQSLQTKDAPKAPKKADEYDIKLTSDMLVLDPKINERLHAKGFTNEQVQEVYDLAAERLVPMITEMMMDVQADRELERIVAKFGGAEKWNKIANELLKFGRKNLDENTFSTLASSYDGVMRLYDMMVSARQVGGFDKRGQSRGGAMDEKTLTKMMRDPKYWKDKDPNFIARVTEGFQDLYA